MLYTKSQIEVLQDYSLMYSGLAASVTEPGAALAAVFLVSDIKIDKTREIFAIF
jgi:hypothetical protein